MKVIYQKEMKTYLTNILTYIFWALLLAVYALILSGGIFDVSQYSTRVVNYELPLYRLLTWFITLIPILMFLTYSVQKGKRVDTNLYTSDISSFKVILGKILAISTIFVLPVLIILLVTIILSLAVFTSSAMTLSIYLLMLLLILISASFSTLIYTAIKGPIIALVVSIVIPNLLLALLPILGKLDTRLFMPYLQGMVPVAVTLILMLIIVLYTAISILVLNRKRNIS